MKKKEENNGVSNDEQEFDGHRLPLFSYTNREVLSISKFEKMIQNEIERVKLLTDGHKAGWIVLNRPDGVLFFDDDVSYLKKVGNKTKQKLANAGIFKANQLIFANLTEAEVNQQLKEISDKSAGPTATKLTI